MASHKKGKRQSGQSRGRGEAADPPAPSAPVKSAAFDAFAYPHLLSLILNHTDTPTLAILLQASKAMHKAVSPRLYKCIRITPLQLRTLLESGWRTKGGPFSATLSLCLQHTQTLHLEAYHHGVIYPKVPRGCFKNCTRVILHVDEPLTTYTFPPLFQSLGSHLYIRLTDDAVLHHQFEKGQAVALLSGLPRSFTAVTLIVPHAYRFSSAPSCGYAGTPSTHKPTLSVVLIPWAAELGVDPVQEHLGPKWLTSAAIRQVVLPHDRVDRYVGTEYTGMVGAEQFLFAPSSFDDYGRNTTPISVTLARWRADLEDETVFSDRERDVLFLAHCELYQRVELRVDRMLAEGLETFALEAPLDQRAEILSKGQAEIEKRKIPQAEMEDRIAHLKERFSKGLSLRPYFSSATEPLTRLQPPATV